MKFYQKISGASVRKEIEKSGKRAGLLAILMIIISIAVLVMMFVFVIPYFESFADPKNSDTVNETRQPPADNSSELPAASETPPNSNE